MAKAGIAGPLMPPVHVTVEPTNACNLRCPVCETGNRSMARDTGMMSLENFCRLTNEISPYTSVMMFYFMGEPFLNKNAYEMIRYARSKGLYVETCTNGDFVDAKGVIYSDINKISFQIGGMTQKTHEVYRVRGDLARTLANLEALIEERRRHPESNVQIEVGFIVMRHNEHEVPQFIRWAEEIGVDIANVIDPCVRTVEEGKRMLPKDRKYWFYDEEAFNHGVLKPKVVPHNECTWIWNSVVINWDGSVVPCCRDPNGLHVFGNAFEEPLRKIWNAEPLRAFRRRIATDQAHVDICRLCSGYGVPNLMPQRPIGFGVKRLSLDATPVIDEAEWDVEAAQRSKVASREQGIPINPIK
ncbi:MAG: radical SAM protein [Nitrospirae bacterium]|nr:MAG: radical SAM protein [Nitrospirota bacterium]